MFASAPPPAASSSSMVERKLEKKRSRFSFFASSGAFASKTLVVPSLPTPTAAASSSPSPTSAGSFRVALPSQLLVAESKSPALASPIKRSSSTPPSVSFAVDNDTSPTPDSSPSAEVGEPFPASRSSPSPIPLLDVPSYGPQPNQFHRPSTRRAASNPPPTLSPPISFSSSSASALLPSASGLSRSSRHSLYVSSLLGPPVSPDGLLRRGSSSRCSPSPSASSPPHLSPDGHSKRLKALEAKREKEALELEDRRKRSALLAKAGKSYEERADLVESEKGQTLRAGDEAKRSVSWAGLSAADLEDMLDEGRQQPCLSLTLKPPSTDDYLSATDNDSDSDSDELIIPTAGISSASLVSSSEPYTLVLDAATIDDNDEDTLPPLDTSSPSSASPPSPSLSASTSTPSTPSGPPAPAPAYTPELVSRSTRLPPTSSPCSSSAPGAKLNRKLTGFFNPDARRRQKQTQAIPDMPREGLMKQFETRVTLGRLCDELEMEGRKEERELCESLYLA